MGFRSRRSGRLALVSKFLGVCTYRTSQATARSDMGPLTRALTGMVFGCFGGTCDVEIAVQTAYRSCTEPVCTVARGGGVVGCDVAHILSGLPCAASGNPDLTEKLGYWADSPFTGADASALTSLMKR